MSELDPIVDKIVVARIGLLLRHPFFGNMATRLRIVDGSDWCNTAMYHKKFDSWAKIFL